MPHLEGAQTFRFGNLNLNIADLSARRSVPQPCDHLIDRRFLTLDVRLDGTIGAIANPAGNGKFASLIPGPGAKEHALHEPGKSNPPSDHHTVAISGASSAFIPTTL